MLMAYIQHNMAYVRHMLVKYIVGMKSQLVILLILVNSTTGY